MIDGIAKLKNSTADLGAGPRRPSSLRVCQVIEATSGGVGRHVIDLVDMLRQDDDLEVHLVWSPIRADEEFLAWVERSGIPQLRLPMLRRPGWQDAPAALALRKYLLRHGPFQVVHGHSSKGGALARLAAMSTGAEVVYTPHALATMNPAMNFLARATLSGAEFVLARLTSHLIAVSPEEARCARQLGLSDSKISVVPNGLRPAPARDRAAVREELAAAPDDVVIGFVGRMVSQKNPRLLVEAFVNVYAQHPQALLAMVGEGPLLQEVQLTAARQNVEHRMRLLGQRAGRPLMSGFDVFALPSRYEGLPYVVLEAMDAGLPIVTTTAANCSLLIEHNQTGFIAAAGDTAAFTEALARLVGDRSLRETMGQAAKSAVGQFGLSRMADETCRVYTATSRSSAGQS